MAGDKNFNFMFFIFDNDFFKINLYDATSLSNVRVMLPFFVDKQVIFLPQLFQNNPSAFKDPANYLGWSNHFFYNDFPTKNPICFVIYEGFYCQLRDLKFFSYLRENYPGCKLVLWIDNPMHVLKNIRKMFLNERDTKEILSTFDCILTFNQVDAMDYGLTYFEGPYSVLPYEQPELISDIFFVGRSKYRLEKILRAYEIFTAQGFVCDFYINDIFNPPAINSNGLHFNHSLSYSEVLEHVLRSRAVLDIAQSNTYGLTMRYFETLAYNKIFITDNAFYRQERFDSPKIFLIDRNLEIDKEQFIAASKLPNNYRNEYSPLRMITFLESVLNS